ncbi:MAG: hypothetical protein AAGH72_13395 [Verrucomicrobiota bacterium]
MKVAARCYLTLLLLLPVSSLLAEAASGDQPANMTTGATISGQGTIELRIDVTQFLKGMGLALIPEGVVTELKEIRNKRWLESASRLKFNAGYYYLDLKSIGYFASSKAVQITRSDAEGNYTFTGIAPGQYRIYGQYKSRYAAGYWLVPVEVQSVDDQINIDINNGNLEEIYNREVK